LIENTAVEYNEIELWTSIMPLVYSKYLHMPKR